MRTLKTPILARWLRRAQESTGMNLAQLSRAVGREASYFSQVKAGRQRLDPDMMVRLAEVAGLDPEQAVIDFGLMWSRGAARPVIEGIARKLGKTAAAALFGLVLSQLGVSLTNEVQAAPHLADGPASGSIHYANPGDLRRPASARLLVRLLVRLLARSLAALRRRRESRPALRPSVALTAH